MLVASHEELNKSVQSHDHFIYGNYFRVTDIDPFEGDDNHGEECVLKFIVKCCCFLSHVQRYILSMVE